MRKFFALFIIFLLGCTASKPAVVAENDLNTLNAKRCNVIRNSEEYVREILKNMKPSEVGFHNGDTTIYEICKPFETMICDGTEYYSSIECSDKIIPIFE